MTLSIERSKHLDEKLAYLRTLSKKLSACSSMEEKIAILNAEPAVKDFFAKRDFLAKQSDLFENYLIKSLAAIGQADKIFAGAENPGSLIQKLMEDLKTIEAFYDDLGGIIGYQILVLEQLEAAFSDKVHDDRKMFYPPPTIDLTALNSEVEEAVREGIMLLPEMGEIYPLGGAGDRLQHKDARTQENLPASKLPFLGRTLLEGLVRDLQGREHLYEKFFGKKINTPIAIMTSLEKNNHAHVVEICEEAKWFGRPKESIKLFCQPSVPTFDQEGNWCLKAPFTLLLKPGGHGVVWKLALQKGIYDWFFKQNREKVLLRQINNPIAGLDYGILALIGFGKIRKKAFGLASCPRRPKASEGMNVLCERVTSAGSYFSISNIEYCKFKEHGIEASSSCEKDHFSSFPANTNILYASLPEMQELSVKNSYPGALINFREQLVYSPIEGSRLLPIARLETTMQNIVDAMEVGQPEDLSVFLTFNHRIKTISAIKKNGLSDRDDTPDSCFNDMMKNSYELLQQHCGFALPPWEEDSHPPCFFLYRPTLGPLYAVIRQKLVGGKMHKNAEMVLEIAEVKIRDLDLSGSLLAHAFDESATCELLGVTVSNQGIDWAAPYSFWQQRFSRKEALRINLGKNAEFFAENISFKGDYLFEVPENRRWTAKEIDGEIKIQDEPSKRKSNF